MIDIHIDKAFRGKAAESALRAAIEAAMQHQGLSGEVSLVVTGDEEIRALNRQHRDEDAATDVLSFPSGEINPESGQPYWGDIVIAYPTAERQAQAAAHDTQAELVFLAVHGLLHLAGHDHADAASKAAMWAAQAEILVGLGLQIDTSHAEASHE
jgi:probable rRNA maturation factor